jgi:hypothetical protein
MIPAPQLRRVSRLVRLRVLTMGLRRTSISNHAFPAPGHEWIERRRRGAFRKRRPRARGHTEKGRRVVSAAPSV